MIKILLTSEPTHKGYSVEAKLHDGKKHFDHHGDYKNESCPANNKSIMPIIEEDAIIEITHIDTDTLFGVYRLLGLDLPEVDLNEVELIDNNGPSVVYPLNKTLMYMRGISKTIQDFKLKITAQPQDVTKRILSMHKYDVKHYLIKGCLAAIEDEEFYHKALLQRKDKVGIYYISKGNRMDTGRPYQDGITHIVLYNESHGSILIFRRPDLETVFNNKEWNNILFEGHEGACGSPRGVRYTTKDALGVFEEVCKYVGA